MRGVSARHRAAAFAQQRRRIDVAEQLDEGSDEACPPGLVRRAEPGAVVAVEVLEEQDEIAPVRVVLEL